MHTNALRAHHTPSLAHCYALCVQQEGTCNNECVKLMRMLPYSRWLMALAGVNRGNHDIMKLRGRAIRSDLPSFPFYVSCSVLQAMLSLALYLLQSASPLSSCSSGAAWLVFFLTSIFWPSMPLSVFSLYLSDVLFGEGKLSGDPSVNVFVCSHSSLRETN